MTTDRDTEHRNELIDRLRMALAECTPLREVTMFGSRAFMLDEAMLVCALAGGRLLVRVDPDQHETLLTRPGANQAEMGPGRDMGPGWIDVAAEVIDTDEGLDAWLRVALEHHAAGRRSP